MSPNDRFVAWAAFGVLVLAAGVVLALGFRRPPQMGADDQVFKTVDALYTAVRLKDAAKVADCERRLHTYRAAGKLPPAAADHLDGVIATARAGEWRPAAERLYAFMQAQRRDGAGG